ncbi:hypothetical protein MKEN_01117200 [Mycena kentingensis (nom. inval.)]|nr:hypothetical protein MKEN_01117200 [Mycena kentingensis (nom. inval.)]
MKFTVLALSIVSLVPALVDAAIVRYCSGTGLAGTCFDETSTNGQCVDVDLSVNDQTHSAKVAGGNCVFFANANCSGDHTDQIDGTINDFNTKSQLRLHMKAKASLPLATQHTSS